MPTCSSCQKHVEATWKVCPFCEERLDSSEILEDNIVIRDSVMMAEKIEIKSGNTSLECPQCKDEGHITLSICKTCDNKFCQSCKTRSIYCEKCSELRRKERLEQERKLEIERLRIQQERYEMQKQTDIANLLLKQEELSEKIKSLNEEYLDLQRTEENLRSDVEDCIDEMSVLRMSKQKLLNEYDVEKNRIFYGKTIEEHEIDLHNFEEVNMLRKWIKIDTSKMNMKSLKQFYIFTWSLLIILPILMFWAGTYKLATLMLVDIQMNHSYPMKVLSNVMDITILLLLPLYVLRIMSLNKIYTRIKDTEKLLSSHELLESKQTMEGLLRDIGPIDNQIEKWNNSKRAYSHRLQNFKPQVLGLSKEIERSEIEFREIRQRLKILKN
jgi:hypothetical protein